MTLKEPAWMWSEPTLELEDPGWHKITIAEGGNPDQKGLLFIRIDDMDDVATAGIDIEEAKAIRDHLGKWIAWCEGRAA